MNGYLKWLPLAFLLFWAAWPSALAQARRVTIVTHGLDSDATGWVLEMASSVRQYQADHGSESDLYFVRSHFAAPPRLSTNETRQVTFTSTDPHKSLVIAFDWSDYAKSLFFGIGVEHSTREVGPALLELLTRPEPLPAVRLPLSVDSYVHLIGHSRGGSLVCGVSSELSRSNVVVAQLTTLDPRPYPLTTDYPAEVGAQVVFADNYYQTQDAVVNGVAVPGAAERQLTLFDSYPVPGIAGNSNPHENVHRWYQRTIQEWDLSQESGSIRALLTNWFNADEQGGARTGYFYSHCEHGMRPPAGFVSRMVSRPALSLEGAQLVVGPLASGPYRFQSSPDLRIWSDLSRSFLLDGIAFNFGFAPRDEFGQLFVRLKRD